MVWGMYCSSPHIALLIATVLFPLQYFSPIFCFFFCLFFPYYVLFLFFFLIIFVFFIFSPKHFFPVILFYIFFLFALIFIFLFFYNQGVRTSLRAPRLTPDLIFFITRVSMPTYAYHDNPQTHFFFLKCFPTGRFFFFLYFCFVHLYIFFIIGVFGST